MKLETQHEPGVLKLISKFAKRYPEEFWKIIEQEYIGGASIKKLADKYQLAYSGVRKHMQRRNIVVRNTKEAAKLYSGTLSSCWNGGRFIDHQNRVWITHEKFGRILEAHLVWLEHNPGDDLKNFDIHHIDHNPQNNAIENLQKLKRSDHRKIHQSPTQNWEKYAKEYQNGKSCLLIGLDLKCSRQCVWKNIKELVGN